MTPDDWVLDAPERERMTALQARVKELEDEIRRCLWCARAAQLVREQKSAYAEGYAEAIEDAAKLFDYDSWISVDVATSTTPRAIAAAIRALRGGE